jgi:hypothetical protein
VDTIGGPMQVDPDKLLSVLLTHQGPPLSTWEVSTPSMTRANHEEPRPRPFIASRPVDQDFLGSGGWGLVLGSFDQSAVVKAGAGADEGDEVGRVDRAPAGLC